MDGIEKRARELLAEGVRSAWPDDHGRRLVIDALLVDGLDFISARVAVKVLAAVLTPPDGYVLVPVKLPVEMEIAFMEAWVCKRRCIDDPEMQDAWEAALAVRPEVP